MPREESSEQIQREQLEISKEFLEHHHGRALRYGTPKEAEAYYDAIKLVEDALEEGWRTETTFEGRWDDGMSRELIETSRDAREVGREDATRHDEWREQQREKYGRSFGIFERVLSWVMNRG